MRAMPCCDGKQHGATSDVGGLIAGGCKGWTARRFLAGLYGVLFMLANGCGDSPIVVIVESVGRACRLLACSPCLMYLALPEPFQVGDGWVSPEDYDHAHNLRVVRVMGRTS